jgi:transcriptional regulator with XRE-family HTH domain
VYTACHGTENKKDRYGNDGTPWPGNTWPANRAITQGKGYTQVELAEKIGIIQVLISDYERDKLRPHPEVIVRFAHALNVTTDELLGLTVSPTAGDKT